MPNRIPFSCSGVVRATADAQLREVQTADGPTHVCTVRGAVKWAGQRDDMGQRLSGYWDFICWDAPAVAAAAVITQGMQFHFDGRPEFQEWGEEGNRRNRTVFVGDFHFLDKKAPSEDAHLHTLPPLDKDAAALIGVGSATSSAPPSKPSSVPADDDIPF